MNYIDINDKNTYPKEFLDFCEKNKERLNNSITEKFYMSFESDLGQRIFNMIKEFEIIAIHANRIYNIESIYNKGLLIPSKSKRLIDIILKPIYTEMNVESSQKIYEKLIEQIKINNKYSELCFIVGNISDITMQNGFLMLEEYGGELLQDIFTQLGMRDFYNKQISKIGQAYAITFYIKMKNTKKEYLNRIMEVMLEKIVLSKNNNIWLECKTTLNVPAINIIGVTKILVEENGKFE